MDLPCLVISFGLALVCYIRRLKVAEDESFNGASAGSCKLRSRCKVCAWVKVNGHTFPKGRYQSLQMLLNELTLGTETTSNPRNSSLISEIGSEPFRHCLPKMLPSFTINRLQLLS